jgi:hypothetical protein
LSEMSIMSPYFREMPITPEKILRALDEIASAENMDEELAAIV